MFLDISVISTGISDYFTLKFDGKSPFTAWPQKHQKIVSHPLFECLLREEKEPTNKNMSPY